MQEYIPLVNCLVNILQAIVVSTIALMMMSIHKMSSERASDTANKVEKVKKTLELSSTELAQESTLKTIEEKTPQV